MGIGDHFKFEALNPERLMGCKLGICHVRTSDCG